jgi:AcrR family transcriptional regulator
MVRAKTIMKSDTKRAAIASSLADIVLVDGLGELALRRAARHLGMSDRMLLYYFGAKSQIVIAVLACISLRQSSMLRADPTAPPASPDRVLNKAWSIVSDPVFVPFMRVWIEVVSRGTRGEPPYTTLGKRAISNWLSWIETRLDLPRGIARRQQAAAILTVLQGATFLEMSNPKSTRGVPKLLSAALDLERLRTQN